MLATPLLIGATARPLGALLFLLLGLGVGESPGFTQEIIVAPRARTQGYGEEAPPPRPAVILPKRADNVVQFLLVTDDTRNAEARLAELEQAIASLDVAAKGSHGVEIALVVDTADGLQLVRPFARDKAIAAVEDGSRPDTAQVRLLAKTAITASDHDQAEPAARIAAFVKSITLAGRAQLEPLGEPALSIVKPERYRAEVTGAIAADAKRAASQLGAEYGARLEGLESPVEWIQLDELDLGLYIQYRLSIAR
jgi:hypothetical protein